ncbi:MAG: dicarboxylate transporter, partial [Massilia sp.]|nr:dicarboxylate transporter [Massilia sp.]
MSHGFELEPAKGPAVPDQAALAGFSLVLDRFNSLLLKLSMGAMVLTALILTYSVVSRYFFNVPTD